MVKYKTLAVVVKLDSGDCYQVALTKGQCIAVADVIVRLHGGKINLLDEELGVDIKTIEREEGE